METLVLTPPRDATAWTLFPCRSLWPLMRKFPSPPRLCRPSCYNPPAPHQITYAYSPQPPLPSPPSLSLSLCAAKSRLWAAEYERNNSGLSGTLCRRWERAVVLRPSQYLDVVAFLCPFLIQAEPSGGEPGKG